MKVWNYDCTNEYEVNKINQRFQIKTLKSILFTKNIWPKKLFSNSYNKINYSVP